MRKIYSLLILTLFLSLQCLGEKQIDSEFAKDMKYLFQINGTEASYQQSIKAMINHFKSQESNVPSEYWEKAEQEFLNTSIDDLMELLVPIYQKNLSHADVQAMIKFYESEAGKRISNKMPNITTESMQAGMIWGQSIGMKIAQDIQSKGYKIRLPFTP